MSADPGRGHRNESDDRARATLQHDAYSYDDADGYVTDLLGFVRGGLARDEPVLIAVPGPNLAAPPYRPVGAGGRPGPDARHGGVRP